jgi:hypothetical protein
VKPAGHLEEIYFSQEKRLMTRNILKNSTLALSIVAFGATLGGAAASAATLQVRCPATQVTASVQDSLPKAWWTTPQGAALADVEVINIGGDWSLLCLYQQSGGLEIGVARHFPPGYGRCEARRSQRDFVCTN